MKVDSHLYYAGLMILYYVFPLVKKQVIEDIERDCM